MLVGESYILCVLRHLDSGRGIVGLRICDVLVMPFSRGMVLFIARMNQALVTDKQVAPGKSLGTYITNERFFLGVSTDVSLEMFLQAVLAFNSLGRVATAEVAGGLTYKPGEESLAVRTRKRLGLVARLFPLHAT